MEYQNPEIGSHHAAIKTADIFVQAAIQGGVSFVIYLIHAWMLSAGLFGTASPKGEASFWGSFGLVVGMPLVTILVAAIVLQPFRRASVLKIAAGVLVIVQIIAAGFIHQWLFQG